jgi:hypothetical protein
MPVFDRGIADANVRFKSRQRSVGSSPDCRGNSKVAATLRRALKRARRSTEIPGKPSFVPFNKMMEVISRENILALLGQLPSCMAMPLAQKKRLVSGICSVGRSSDYCCRRLVATLIDEEREDGILPVISRGLRDDCLLNQTLITSPQQGQSTLNRPDHMQMLFEILGIDDEDEKNTFYESANRYTAPYFTRPDTGVYHYVFDLSTVLPFMEQSQPASRPDNTDDGLNINTEGGQGGYGTVRRTKLHPNHHGFSNFGV